jgi:hypothetical protein
MFKSLKVQAIPAIADLDFSVIPNNNIISYLYPDELVITARCDFQKIIEDEVRRTHSSCYFQPKIGDGRYIWSEQNDSVNTRLLFIVFVEYQLEPIRLVENKHQKFVLRIPLKLKEHYEITVMMGDQTLTLSGFLSH